MHTNPKPNTLCTLYTSMPVAQRQKPSVLRGVNGSRKSAMAPRMHRSSLVRVRVRVGVRVRVRV